MSVRRLAVQLAAAGSVLATAGAGVAAVGPAAHTASASESAFLAHLNGLRYAHGLSALASSSDLVAVAEQHSQQMAAAGTIFHNSNLTGDVNNNWRMLGENVGMGPSVDAVDTAFDHSPEHYANEVNSAYTQVGIGTSTRNGEIYVTLDFRQPMTASAPAPAPKPAPKPVRVFQPAPRPVVAPVRPVVRPVPHPVSAPAQPVTAPHRVPSPASPVGHSTARSTAQSTAPSTAPSTARSTARSTAPSTAHAVAAPRQAAAPTRAQWIAPRAAHPLELPMPTGHDPLAQLILFSAAVGALSR